jgi:glycosyltransferase involved in cell wall biosynthesis
MLAVAEENEDGTALARVPTGMHLLWVKAGKLLPVDTGGKIRSYNLLRQLAAHHQLVLLSYYGGTHDAAYEDEIRQLFPGAEPVHDGSSQSGLSLYMDYARRLLSPVPYAVAKFSSRRIRHTVQALLDERRFDVAVCDFLSASGNFPRRLETPSVLFQHNVESILWRRQAAHEPNLLKRLAFTMEASKMSRYERDAVRRFHRVIAVSDHDRTAMAEMTDPVRVSVVPTGVDVEGYRSASRASADRPIVMFLGSMDWEANIDAANYFCRDIWPSVCSAVPGALLRIVGRAPHLRVRRLASGSVDVTGTVPSVVDYLKETAVFVVPLRIGGGTRLKIFEAMAAEKAVVSTSIGAEGLDVTDGRDILLADTARAFADSVIALLRDPVRRRQLERAAGQTAARHDWSVIARRFEDVLREAIARPDPVDRLSVEAARVEA